MLLPRRALLVAPALAAPASAQEAVDLLLVLAMDASGSIDGEEFRLQREGYAEALTHPQVVAAIRSKRRGAVAIAMLEWGSPGGSVQIVDWHRVSDAASAQALAGELLAADRAAELQRHWRCTGAWRPAAARGALRRRAAGDRPLRRRAGPAQPAPRAGSP